MKIKCPSYVLTALKLLKASGYHSYIVGGCVRDAIMNKTPNDWDMTTSAVPDEILNIFDGFHTIPTGLKHGTVTVMIEKHPLEITTMRIDGEYSDNRRPDSVSFTHDIKKDLSRRDFTVNAIAYNPEDGLIDPFGGRNDIANRIIRCVGSPDRRFGEDALRIIRALRFASTLGFDVEDVTADSIIRNRNLLTNVASERIRVELIKLLQGKNAEKILTDFKTVVFTIIPELEPLDGFNQMTPYHIYDIWTHTVKVVVNVTNSKELRIAALLHDIGKPEKFTIDGNGTGHFKGHPAVSEKMSREILSRLRFSNAEIDDICSIIALHDMRPNGEKKQIARQCSKYSIQAVSNAIKLMKADAAAKNPDYYDMHMKKYLLAEKQLEEIVDERLCLKVNELKINGNDLIALGARGRQIHDILDKLLEKVVDEETENDCGKLIKEAKKLI